MSANPSNARSEWLGLASPRIPEPRDEGHNALQALFAFASLNQQAIERHTQSSGSEPPDGTPQMPGQNFALDEVLKLVVARAVSITGADGVAIALAHEGAIVCRASAGQIAPDPGVRLDPSSGFSGACLRSGETVRCDDSEIDGRVNALACRALGARSMVAVPLSAKQRVIGLIEAFSKETYGFNDADVGSLNLLGELVLAAIRPEEEDRLAEISRRVILTVPEPTVAPSGPAQSPGPIAKAPAKIIVDEKFAPWAAKPQVSSRGPSESTTPEVWVVPPEVSKPKVSPKVAAEKAPAESSTVSGEVTDTAEQSAQTGVTPAVLPPLQTTTFAPQEVGKPGPEAKHSLVGRVLVIATVLIAVGFGWLVWQKIRHAEQSISANTPPAAEVKTEEVVTHDLPNVPEPISKPGTLPLVTGIHNSASANSSTVVVDLEDQVQYEAHTLSDPDRIYFDLHDTRVASTLANQNIVPDDDPFLKRIRVAQPVEGVTRVVLETKGAAQFTVSLSTNPYKLNIDLHKPSAATEIKATPAPNPKPLPRTTNPPGKTKASMIPEAEFRLVLDAGHGGWDLGTVGRKGLLEKDLVLDIVQRLGKLAEDNLGAQVIYTRQDDEYLPLEKRAEIANLAKADLFLSVHANYSDLPTARGVETYYTNTYSSLKARTDGDDPQLKQVDWTGVDIRAKVTESHRLAGDVQQALYGALATRNPEIRNRGVKEAQYVVLTGTQMPAVLAEVSFVSSPADEDKLQSSAYRQQIAEALFKGIVRYHDENKHMKLASAKKN